MIAFLIAIATSKQCSVLQNSVSTRRKREANSPNSRSNGSGTDGSSDSNSEGDSDSDSDSDRDSDSPAFTRADVENRLAAFQREQEASLQEFRATPTAETNRQRRILSDRSAAESGRLTAAIDNLRRRFVDHQVNLKETNRAIQELRSRGPHTPRGTLPAK